MKVVMIGTGYVGLVTGTCFADSGNDVTCLDVDEAKIAALRRGEAPIYEPGLQELIVRNVEAGRLSFTTSYAEAIPSARCVFLCVGTPTRNDGSGSADTQYIEAAARAAAPHLAADAIVVVKSTVPVGTNAQVEAILREAAGRLVDVASNPEFLKEGAAIEDFTRPDRVVVGVARREVAEALRELYRPFLWDRRPFLVMSRESAEATKYVANCMLATKISFINEMANICEKVGADINDVRAGITADRRIGDQFLYPGVGYGGSCFPKDVRELIALARRQGIAPRVLEAVDAVNNQQKSVLFLKIRERFRDLAGVTVAIWGLAFKPRTDDVREAPSKFLINSLLEARASVRVHDPEAMENIRRELGERIAYFDDQYEALRGADCLAILTEWQPFRTPDFARMKSLLRQPLVFDGRNLYRPDEMRRHGFHYDGIGLKPPAIEERDGPGA